MVTCLTLIFLVLTSLIAGKIIHRSRIMTVNSSFTVKIRKGGEKISFTVHQRHSSDGAGDLPVRAAQRQFDFEPPTLMWSTETEQSHN